MMLRPAICGLPADEPECCVLLVPEVCIKSVRRVRFALIGAAKAMAVHYSRDQQSESIFPLDDPTLPKRAMILP
jgi:hypothetical protein